MPTLALIAHAPSPNTRRLADAVLAGARTAAEAVTVRVVPPLEAGPADVRAADALILGTTENFGYMSGAMKDFFDRTYYPCLEETQGRPYAIYIRACLDGTGTRTAMERIIAGLRWRAVQPALILQGAYRDAFEDQCRELGATVAAGLELGIL